MLIKQGFEKTAVGIEAGGVQDGVLGAQKGRELGLQVFVRRLGTAEKRTEAIPKP